MANPSGRCRLFVPETTPTGVDGVIVAEAAAAVAVQSNLYAAFGCRDAAVKDVLCGCSYDGCAGCDILLFHCFRAP